MMRMLTVPFEADSTSFAQGTKMFEYMYEVGGAGKANRSSTGCWASAQPEKSAAAANRILLIESPSRFFLLRRQRVVLLADLGEVFAERDRGVAHRIAWPMTGRQALQDD